MPPDVLARITEPFFTTKEAGKGTGLGLSQVYGFVRQSSGSLQVTSEVGVGTVVTMLFPASSEERLPTHDQAFEPLDDDNNDGAVILVVEDNAEVLEMACTILREEGYQVITADSAGRALEVLENTPHVNILFSDVVMPGGMNGVMLAEEAKRRRPALKLLLTTGFAEDFMKRETNIQFPVLQKPYRPSELRERIRRLVQED
jgi:CheY-like chemotaxis protein